MDKKSKIFFSIFSLLIVGSVAVTYWRIMIKKDYIIEAQADCDPYTEKCFVWECDPASDVEGEACTGDAETDTWYFQVIQRNASRIPLCDPNDETCDALVCGDNEPECSVAFCTEDTMEAQYATACNDPIVYTEENPIEEECDPAVDETCVIEDLCDPAVDAECVTDEEPACDPATEDCNVDENVPAEAPDATATEAPDATKSDTTTPNTTDANCDSTTSAVCPIGTVKNTTPELE